MIADAEKYKKEDNIHQERMSAKNSLESFCFHIKQTINMIQNLILMTNAIKLSISLKRQLNGWK
jgi:hypothetical protein